MKKNILITGANGFIGSNFAEKNFKKYNLYGVVKKNKKKIKGVKYLNIKNFNSKIYKKIHFIIHLAQSKNYKNFLINLKIYLIQILNLLVKFLSLQE